MAIALADQPTQLFVVDYAVQVAELGRKHLVEDQPAHSCVDQRPIHPHAHVGVQVHFLRLVAQPRVIGVRELLLTALRPHLLLRQVVAPENDIPRGRHHWLPVGRGE